MKYSFGNLVQHAIGRHLGLEDGCIEASQRLREDLGLLPLDLVLIALCLEDVAHARFPVEGLVTVHTVEDLTRFLWSCRCAPSREVATPGVAPERMASLTPVPAASRPRRSLPVVMPGPTPRSGHRPLVATTTRAPRH